MTGDWTANATNANVAATTEKLRKSPVLSELVAGGKLLIVPATYRLETGVVTLL